MKFQLLFIFTGVMLCINPACANNGINTKKINISGKDKEQIEKLVTDAYKWSDDYYPANGINLLAIEEDNKYTGLDLDRHKTNMRELRDSNFFAEEFLDNYNSIVQTINTKLGNGEFEWLEGDLPPFGNDADPWCDCQDSPDDTWDNISFTFIEERGGYITLMWNWTYPGWDKGAGYKVKVKKEDDKWKIAYLQGFDYNYFFSIDY